MTTHYDRVYWLTLNRTKDRQDHFLSCNMSQLNDVPILRITGFDAQLLGISEDYASGLVIDSAGKGVIGCYLSHMLTLKIAGMHPNEVALILEDDCILDERFDERLRAFLETNQEWNVAMLTGEDGFKHGGSEAYLVRTNAIHDIVRLMESRREHGMDDFFKKNATLLKIRWSIERFVTQRRATLASTLMGDFNQEQINSTGAQLATRSFSQYGEDNFVMEFFHAKEMQEGETRKFLEIGALDGVKDSNCRKLALAGWHGVCIEPNPYHFIRLHRNYQGNERVQVLCALVGSESQIRVLHLNSDGLSTSHPDIFIGMKDRVYFPSYCNVPSVTPEQIAARFGNQYSFVSVDAEGMDMYILECAGPILQHTQLICVEKAMPGKPVDLEYIDRLKATCARHGLSKMELETEGNLLFSRP